MSKIVSPVESLHRIHVFTVITFFLMLSPVVQVKVLPCYSLFFPQDTPGMHDKASHELLNLSCTVRIQGFGSFYRSDERVISASSK